MSIEMAVAIAMVMTVLAIACREPLTRKRIELTPADAGRLFDAYAYNDGFLGGTSTAAGDAVQPLSWTCTLRGGIAWPFCGFGLLFDREHAGKGLDLDRYDQLKLQLDYHGSAKLIRVTLKDSDLRYRALANPADKVNQISFPLREGTQTIPLPLSDFAVAEWWKDRTRAPPVLDGPSFHNIVAVEFIVPGNDGALGPQQLRIRRVSIERDLISAQAWYGGIALAWILLILSVLLYRRRQIVRIRHSADQALRESERLYRTILEASADCIVLLGADGTIEFINQAGLAAFELPELESIRGRHWTEFWIRDEISKIESALAAAARGETTRVGGPGPTARGTRRWWDAIVSSIFDEHGSVKGLLCVSRDVTSERERSEQLRWASEHDSLSGLPNRRAFQKRLETATARAMETGDQIGLLLIDLDHFKHVNDAFGHAAGDDLLKAVADRLRNAVREEAFVARIGGDEFAIILEHSASDEAVQKVGDELLSSIQAPLRTSGRAVSAGASIGGALFPAHAATANDLFKSADTALYALKHDGRSGTRMFDRYMLDEAERSASQLRLARGAVNERTLVPVYQPKFELDRRLVGLEALLRWRHPRDGLQLPAMLEEAFGDYELAAKIGELMQRKVARDVRAWLDSGLDFGRIAINAAPAEFLRDDYAERFLSVLKAHDLPPSRFEVEVTEHAFVGRATQYVARALDVLSAAGITISLDDFGTGSSSLSHLRDFPVDVVKIDMSFIQQMTENDEIAAIVAAVIRLARSLSIEVIAEGVETAAQLDLLRVMGCHIAQGHLLSAALEADAVASLALSTRAAA